MRRRLLKLRLSLSARMLALVSIVIILLFSALIYRHYLNETGKLENNLALRMQLKADFLAASIAQAMWDFNLQYIHSAAQSVFEDPDIEGVIIRDNQGKPVEQIGRTPQDERHFLSRSNIRYTLAGKTEAMGAVELSVSRVRNYALLNEYLRGVILESAAFLVCLLLIIRAVLRHLLQPVKSITDAMLDLARGKTLADIPSQKRHDEIGQMARAIQIFRNTAVRASELEQEVEMRRALQKQLESAKEEAQQATRMKTKFLANMSHEIRTPMNIILGYANMLLDSPLSLEQKDQVSTIRRSGEILIEIINDILDISKIEAGRLEIERVSFGLKPVVDEVVKIFSLPAAEKFLPLVVEYGDGLPGHFIGDSHRLRQVLMNLVGNAIKFTQTGHVKIRVDYAAGNNELQCSVEDTGIGIKPENVHRIFEDFSQEDMSITRRYGGSGLGLAICRRLLEMMGGRLAVESTPGKGSMFSFTVPLPVDAAPKAEAKAGASEAPIHASVLVVEDLPLNQRVARYALEKIGCTVDVAASGAEALEKTAQRSYDLVFMDMQMPQMDGLEATRRIRARKDGGHFTIVAMTASAQVEDRDACRQAGMNDFISKPLQPKILRAMLEKYAKTSGHAAA